MEFCDEVELCSGLALMEPGEKSALMHKMGQGIQIEEQHGLLFNQDQELLYYQYLVLESKRVEQ